MNEISSGITDIWRIIKMTGQELIDWIKANKAENFYIRVAYRDGGGYYSGYDEDISPTAEIEYGSGLKFITL